MGLSFEAAPIVCPFRIMPSFQMHLPYKGYKKTSQSEKMPSRW